MTMEISAAANVNTTLATQDATSLGFADLRPEDFLALMIQELKSQDPLDPQDTGQLLEQLSSIRQIEQATTTANTLGSLAQALQAFNGARFADPGSLIGSFIAGTVTGPNGESTELQGVVLGVRFEGNGEAIFELHNGTSIPADRVEQITLVENLPPEILEQLQEELGSAAEGDTVPPAEDETDTTGNLAALLKNADPAGIKLRHSPQTTSSIQRDRVVAQLLGSLFSIGTGVKIGL